MKWLIYSIVLVVTATNDDASDENSESDTGLDVFLYVGVSIGLVVGISVGSIVIVLKKKRCCCKSASEHTTSVCNKDMRNNEISYRRYSSSIGIIDGTLNVDSRGMMFLSMDQHVFSTLPLQSNQRIANPSIPLDERMKSTLPRHSKRNNSLPRSKSPGFSRRNNSLPRKTKCINREKEIDILQNKLCKIHSKSTEPAIYQRMNDSVDKPTHSHEALYANTNLLQNGVTPYVYDQPVTTRHSTVLIETQ